MKTLKETSKKEMRRKVSALLIVFMMSSNISFAQELTLPQDLLQPVNPLEEQQPVPQPVETLPNDPTAEFLSQSLVLEAVQNSQEENPQARPAGTVVVNQGKGYVNTPYTSIHIGASGNPVEMSYVVTAKGEQPTFTFWTGFSKDTSVWVYPQAFGGQDGEKVLHVKLKDSQGNESEILSSEFTVDSIAPTASLLVNSGNGQTRTRNISFNVQAADERTGLKDIRYSVNGGENWSDWKEFSESRELLLSGPDGQKDILVEVRDRAENMTRVTGTVLLQTGASVDLIEAANNAFSWGNVDFSQTYRSGDRYFIKSQNPHYEIGTAFVHNQGLDMTGKKIIFRYKSTTGVAYAHLELKDILPQGGFLLPAKYYPLKFENTGGEARTLEFLIPGTPQFSNINEAILMAKNSGQPFDLEITGFDLVELDYAAPPVSNGDLLANTVTSWTSLSTGSYPSPGAQAIYIEDFGMTPEGGYHFSGTHYGGTQTQFWQNLDRLLDAAGKTLRIEYESSTGVPAAYMKLRNAKNHPSPVYEHWMTPKFEVTEPGERRVLEFEIPDQAQWKEIDELTLYTYGGNFIDVTFHEIRLVDKKAELKINEPLGLLIETEPDKLYLDPERFVKEDPDDSIVRVERDVSGRIARIETRQDVFIYQYNAAGHFLSVKVTRNEFLQADIVFYYDDLGRLDQFWDHVEHERYTVRYGCAYGCDLGIGHEVSRIEKAPLQYAYKVPKVELLSSRRSASGFLESLKFLVDGVEVTRPVSGPFKKGSNLRIFTFEYETGEKTILPVDIVSDRDTSPVTLDIVADASNAFSWDAHGYRIGDEFFITPNPELPDREGAGTAFVFNGETKNMSGAYLRVLYSTKQDAGDHELQFKGLDVEGNLEILHTERLYFENTGSEPREIFIRLPETELLNSITQIVMPHRTSLEMIFHDLDLVGVVTPSAPKHPAFVSDLIYSAIPKPFTWGEGAGKRVGDQYHIEMPANAWSASAFIRPVKSELLANNLYLRYLSNADISKAYIEYKGDFNPALGEPDILARQEITLVNTYGQERELVIQPYPAPAKEIVLVLETNSESLKLTLTDFDLIEDITAPVGQLFLQGDYTASTRLDYSIVGSEMYNLIRFSTDEQQSWTSERPYWDAVYLPQGASDGEKRIWAQMTDYYGNWSAPFSDTIVLDTTAPVGTALIKNGVAYTSSASNSVALNFSDHGSGIKDVRLRKATDTDWSPWMTLEEASQYPVTFSDPDESKKVEVEVRDRANNVVKTDDDIFFDDTMPPVGTIAIENSAQYANQNTLKLYLTASDEGGSGIKDMRFSKDAGKTWTAWASFAGQYDLDVSDIQDGSLTVFYQVRDNADNIRQVDAPSIRLSFSGGNFFITVQDSVGVLSYDILYTTDLTSGNWTVLQHDVPVSGTGTSIYNVGPPASPQRFYAVRVARNEGGSFSDAIILDRGLPAGSIQSFSFGDQTLGQAYNRGRVTLTGISDSLSGVKELHYRLAGGAWTVIPFAGTPDMTFDFTLPDFWGTKNIEFEIEDYAGNKKLLTKTVTVAVEAYLKEVEMRYLTVAGTVDTASQYPVEGWNQRGYTQPSHIGFYAQLLANIVSGDFITDKITAAQARVKLQTLVTVLLQDQKNLGHFGLIPWFNFNGNARERASGDDGHQVMFQDNSNLSVALAAASGALRDLAAQSDVNQIITDIESFLGNQQDGYSKLFDSTEGQFRRGCWIDSGSVCNPVDNGYHDIIGDEARSGIQFVMLRYNFPDSAFVKADIQFKTYTKANGEKQNVIAPFNGSAFQMLWPVLTMPETLNAGLEEMLKDFVDIALDHSERNGLTGLVSANWEVCAAGDTNPDCAARGTKYNFFQGLAQIAVDTSKTYNERVGSLYPLGAAFMVDAVRVRTRLEAIMTQYGSLFLTDHGLWEGFDHEQNQTVQEQVSSNVLTFILGLIGQGQVHMSKYLRWKDTRTEPAGHPGYYKRLETLYKSTALDILRQSNEWCRSENDVWKGCSTSVPAPLSLNVAAYRNANLFFKRSGSGATNSYEVWAEKLVLNYTSNLDLSNVTIEFKPGDGLAVIIVPNVKLTAGTNKELSLGLPPNKIFDGMHQITILTSGGSGTQTLNFTINSFNLTGSNKTALVPVSPVQPVASVVIDGGAAFTTDLEVDLVLSASTGVNKMRFSVDNGRNWTNWENYATSRKITLPDGAGMKEVRVQVQKSDGKYSDLYFDQIIYNVPATLSQVAAKSKIIPLLINILDQMAKEVKARQTVISNQLKTAKSTAVRKQLTQTNTQLQQKATQMMALKTSLQQQQTVVQNQGTGNETLLADITKQLLGIYAYLYQQNTAVL